MFLRRCSWCGRWLGLRFCWPLRWQGVTHGICRKCAKRVWREYAERMYQKYEEAAR